MSHRLRHDVAFKAAINLHNMACSALMDTEQHDFHEESYRIIMAALEAYDAQRQREEARLKPSLN